MIRIGLLGAGRMGSVHAAAYATIEGVEIARVAGRDPEGVGALLADASIDAVDVTVPTPLHEECVLAALGAGKHVFCETPLAKDAPSCARMIEAARASGRLLQVALLARVAQPGARLRQAVLSGELGEVEHAEFYRLAPVPDRGGHGDALEEILLFDLDLITWLWGRPRSVRADMGPAGASGIQTAAVSLIFDGLRATVTGGFAVPAGSPLNTTLRVAGSQAELSASLMLPPGGPPMLTCLLTPEGRLPRRLHLVAEDPCVEECRHFIDCIRGAADPALLSAESALPAFELLDAARTSIEQGERFTFRPWGGM
jgi:predicted dehydrogenase